MRSSLLGRAATAANVGRGPCTDLPAGTGQSGTGQSGTNESGRDEGHGREGRGDGGRCGRCRFVTSCGTWRSSPTSTMARRRWSTRMLRQSGMLRPHDEVRRAGPRLDGPRARKGHHDPRQAGGVPLRGAPAEPRRHPGPRRLRRRGRARPGDGRRGDAARRRRGGPPPTDRASCCARPSRRGCPSSRCSTRSTAPTPASREVVNETLELFVDLDAPEHQLEIPFLYGSARAGCMQLEEPDGPILEQPAGSSLAPLIEALFAHLPAPSYTEGAPLQALVTNLDASPYLGRLAICRVVEGSLRRGQIDRLVQAGRHDRARAQRRAARRRGARAGARRRGAPGRHRRRRRHRRGDRRRDPRRSRGHPTAAAARDRRAEPVDDRRHQHLAARRPRRHQAHGTPVEGAPRGRGARQRRDPCPPDRARRHLRGAGPRRARPRRARRADAPRRLRAHRRQARGAHPPDRRAPARAHGAPVGGGARGASRHAHPAARQAQGPSREDRPPRHGLGAPRAPRACPRPDRRPLRGAHPDPRHRPAAPRLRALRALARRDPHTHRRAAWSPTGAG